MSDIAFRFLGHMATRSVRIVQAAGQKNIRKLALETGLNVIELIGSIVSYSEAKQQTGYLHQKTETVKSHNEEVTAIHEQMYAQKLTLLQQQLEDELRVEQKQLKFELQAYAEQLETQYAGDASSYEQNKKLHGIVAENLCNFQRILEKAEQYLDTLTDEDNVKKQALFEEYRKIQRQVNQLVKTLY
ncbi:hypothetical protein [Domibacillus mangrovi]|uniref:DUF5082 domain-containing protein n=1 Tax=Domibacillus mangrovi TaxID=1714354 RepID=A0A1Q5P6P0_9BACI|nr:hypothetical protein [Domibacillus mangrovi]OKL37884.1 hypothetical protein BLL40_00170 [Domibacillus mangrovi]